MAECWAAVHTADANRPSTDLHACNWLGEDEEEIDRRDHMVKNAAIILLLAGQTSQLEHFHDS